MVSHLHVSSFLAVLWERPDLHVITYTQAALAHFIAYCAGKRLQHTWSQIQQTATAKELEPAKTKVYIIMLLEFFTLA